MLYKLEKSDFYDDGENLLYKKMKHEKRWNFESDEIISRLKCCFTMDQGCNRTLIDLISYHYSISSFINCNLLNNVVRAAEQPAGSKTCDIVSNLSELLFKNSNINELREYIDQLKNELLVILDSQEVLHSELILHKVTLNIIILTNAFDSSSSVQNFQAIIYKSFITFKRLLDNSSATYCKFGFVKIVESFINVS